MFLLLLLGAKSEDRKSRLNDVECSWVCGCISLDDCSDVVEKQKTAGIDANSTKKRLKRPLIFVRLENNASAAADDDCSASLMVGWCGLYCSLLLSAT